MSSDYATESFNDEIISDQTSIEVNSDGSLTVPAVNQSRKDYNSHNSPSTTTSKNMKQSNQEHIEMSAQNVLEELMLSEERKNRCINASNKPYDEFRNKAKHVKRFIEIEKRRLLNEEKNLLLNAALQAEVERLASSPYCTVRKRLFRMGFI